MRECKEEKSPHTGKEDRKKKELKGKENIDKAVERIGPSVNKKCLFTEEGKR